MNNIPLDSHLFIQGKNMSTKKITHNTIFSPLTKKEASIDLLLLNPDTHTVLKIFSELTPNNKSLFIEQLKALHQWQTKFDTDYLNKK